MSKTVMVIDDDEHIRDALSMILEDEGYTAICAEDGRVALDQLQQGVNPCLIFLDLMMPVMDGWQFRQAQKADPAHARVPVVVITAAGPGAGTIDAEVVLHKPISAETVLRAVNAFC